MTDAETIQAAFSIVERCTKARRNPTQRERRIVEQAAKLMQSKADQVGELMAMAGEAPKS